MRRRVRCRWLIAVVALVAACSTVPPTSPAAAAGETWALLVATSHGPENHRHQADVLAAYQLLRANGVDDDHIVLVSADDLGGEVRASVDGPDLRAGAVVDHDIDDVHPADLGGLLADVGRDDRVVVLLAGHGDHEGVHFGLDGPGRGSPAGSTLTPAQLSSALAGLPPGTQTLVAIEACDAGVFASVARDGVVVLAAAADGEDSHATHYDRPRDVWLADAFAAALVDVARSSPDATIDDAYMRIRRVVHGSTPALFGDPGGERLGDFFSR